MLTWGEKLAWPESEWQEQYQKLQKSSSIVSLVITAWQIGLWFARWLVEQELEERAKRATVWGRCPLCGHRLESKGLVPRRLLGVVQKRGILGNTNKRNLAIA
jgi:hypothetical protein